MSENRLKPGIFNALETSTLRVDILRGLSQDQQIQAFRTFLDALQTLPQDLQTEILRAWRHEGSEGAPDEEYLRNSPSRP